MFYNQLRRTKSQAKMSSMPSLGNRSSSTGGPRERLINLQKREKLKSLLITKYMKQHGLQAPEKMIEDEISNFLQSEKINDADLKRLDAKIHKLILGKKSDIELKNTLNPDLDLLQSQVTDRPVEDTIHTKPEGLNSYNSNPNIHQPLTKKNQAPTIVPNLVQRPASLSMNSTPCNNARPYTAMNYGPTTTKGSRRKVYKSPEEELAALEAEEAAAKPHREEPIDFASDGDEWNAIAQYNKKKFDEELLSNRIKDKEVKQRTREELDLQVKQKLKKEYEEKLKSREQDSILMKHLENLKEIEKQKAASYKEQVIREKDNRNVQMQNEFTRKKIEDLKNKQFDRELVKNIINELENDKKAVIEKKQKANDALLKGLKENELNKIKRQETLLKEKKDDIKSAEEYCKGEDKKDFYRREYYKNIERRGNNFVNSTASSVLEEMKRKNDEEELKRKQVIHDREIKALEDDERKNKEMRETKQFMKSYYDMQVDEKRRNAEFNKCLDGEQARLWNVDCSNFFQQEKEIQQKIKKMNKNNLTCVLAQIEQKRNKKTQKGGMNSTEYAFNRSLVNEARKYK